MLPVLPAAGAVTINVFAVADVTVAEVPLNLTVLSDAVVLKLEPLMVTETPGLPDVGVIELTTGAGAGLLFLQPGNINGVKSTAKSK